MCIFLLATVQPTEATNIPAELLRRYQVVIYPRSSQLARRMRQVDARYIGGLVSVKVCGRAGGAHRRVSAACFGGRVMSGVRGVWAAWSWQGHGRLMGVQWMPGVRGSGRASAALRGGSPAHTAQTFQGRDFQGSANRISQPCLKVAYPASWAVDRMACNAATRPATPCDRAS